MSKLLDTSAETLEIKKTAKRDYLRDLEQRAQKSWAESKLFEIDAPAPPSGKSYKSMVDAPTAAADFLELQKQHPKWMGTFPYPYMNGSLHLGHAFTISKIEFAAGFNRMLGKRALLPMGFHLTGMPIKSSCDKLIREMEMFGPDLERFEDPSIDTEVERGVAPTAPNGELDVAAAPAAKSADPAKAKKGKIQNKSTGLQYQFQIMELIGVPRKDIKKFADPAHWAEFFPPIAMEDLDDMGGRVDWRRSFVTTDTNPYYDSFVRWQMNKLHAQGRIKFGERYTIFSPKDDQPCMDHDRASGEGVGPQEYIGYKMEVKEWAETVPEDVKKALGGRKAYMVAASLRSETCYGQTACFVGPPITYGVFEVNENEAFIITDRAARNMSYQGTFAGERGKVTKLAEVKGAELVGSRVTAPGSLVPEVYVLPMDGVSATKGTAVVTCCASDSPDDYATIMDLRKKPEYYKIKPEWAATEPVALIRTEQYGDMIAPTLVAQMKINSQKDKVQLAEAKDIAYKIGFNYGTMIVGEFAGEPVSVAKPKVRKSLIAKGLAVAYAEPENQVMSRSADECVVALCDQWYLDYGEEEWKAIAKKLLAQMNTYFPETRNQFEGVLDWLNQWACARSYGLGSKLPWDPQFLVESLSDSTIYMSYLTVSHLLQGGSIYGDKAGPLGITANQLTDEMWEYILLNGKYPADSAVPEEKAAELKYSFNYFYPMDVRSSGKDLIPNHLTFCIYVHAALFEERHWPRSMRANGHLLLNGKKMSKSTGNFLTLREALGKFGADATRLTMADAGDDINDANFEELTANASILRLHTACEWAQEVKESKKNGQLRTGAYNLHDRAFEIEIDGLVNQAKVAFENMAFKDALRFGFYSMQTARDWYREVTLVDNGGEGMHSDLIFHWIRVSSLLVQPIIPHFAEFMWKEILEEPKSIQLAQWPETSSQRDDAALARLEYMRGVLSSMRSAEATIAKKKGKGKAGIAFDPSKPRSGRIFVATSFPSWQAQVIDSIKESYEQSGSQSVDDKEVRASLERKGLAKDKRAMPFMQQFKRALLAKGPDVFQRSLPFDELEALTVLSPYIKASMRFQDVSVVSVEEALAAIEKDGEKDGWDKAKVEVAEPGSPETVFWNV